ncbi:MAG: sugar phosphate isomerase/epimerase family protein [Christensenellaceae bacterium]|jgi:sugar phosphate isomerase/epimerase
MKLGLTADCLGMLSFDEVLDACQKWGLDTIEIGCGAWSSAPHIDLDGMLASKEKRSEYVKKIEDHGLKIAALNVSGNPTAPGDYGKKHREDTKKTFQLAEMLGVKRVVMMSGLPGGPGDANPNWVLVHWPPKEVKAILDYQWNEVTIPFWKENVKMARDYGIEKLPLETHGWQLVYNTENLIRLRQEIGGVDDLVGLNMDPSHALWMGADPIQMIREIGDMIFYAHVKDVQFNPDKLALNTCMDTKPGKYMKERSWNFVNPGVGHDEIWWTRFVRELQLAGYDDVLSFEMEDHSGDPVPLMTKGIEFIRRITG